MIKPISEERMELYWYGMRLRGYSMGAQPKGVYVRRDDPRRKYHDLIAYERELTADECRDYELDFIGKGTYSRIVAR